MITTRGRETGDEKGLRSAGVAAIASAHSVVFVTAGLTVVLSNVRAWAPNELEEYRFEKLQVVAWHDSPLSSSRCQRMRSTPSPAGTPS
jgi:hypothetical protein